MPVAVDRRVDTFVAEVPLDHRQRDTVGMSHEASAFLNTAVGGDPDLLALGPLPGPL
jgi:hypothetical protein